MTEWHFAQKDPAEELCRLHHFSFKKLVPDGEVEFVVIVREYVGRNQQHMKFYAEADKQVNQGVAPFTPFGWGETLLAALSECLRAVRAYPYVA